MAASVLHLCGTFQAYEFEEPRVTSADVEADAQAGNALEVILDAVVLRKH